MKISSDGRFFTDADGNPLFWLGDTQWELFRGYSFRDAAVILRDRNNKGFSFIQVMLLGVKPGPNTSGEEPFQNADLLRPGEGYFRHVDEVVNLAGGMKDLNLVIGVYHKSYPKGLFRKDNAGAWARGLGQRYREKPHIVWSMYPEAKPEYVSICRELAAGFREGDGGSHLITIHPDPSPASSGDLFHTERWLDFNSIQTFKDVDLICPMVEEDARREPRKPVVMAEGAYEAGIEYGFDVTPLWIRRQAYYSYFSGGHHSYGHNDSWRMLPTWKAALDAPGARQMAVLKKIFVSLPEWWRLVPDPSLLVSDSGMGGTVLTLAARHPEGSWILVYSGGSGRVSLDPGKIGKSSYKAEWIDPRDGTHHGAGTVPASGPYSFSVPAALEDGLLLLEKIS